MYLFTLIAVAFLPTALSQRGGSPTCTVRDVDFTFNSAGRSPCQVATALAGVCSSDWSVGPLQTGQAYSPAAVPDDCQCNTVTYSMLSACAACQGGTWINFNQFTENCTSVFFSMFPEPLPAGLAVPSWAYNNLQLTSNTFDLEAARLQNGGLDSTAVASPTPGIPPIFSTQTTTPNLALSTSTASPSLSANNTISTSAVASESGLPASALGTDSPGSSSAGAIAGGIVGGIAALMLLLCLLLFYLQRHQRPSQRGASSTTQFNPASPRPDKSEMLNTIEKPLACQSLASAFYDASDRSTLSSPEAGTVASHTSHYVPYSKTLAARNSIRNSQTQQRILRSMLSTPSPSEFNPFEDPEACTSGDKLERHDE